MNRRWMSQTYREEAGEGGEAGYKPADADSMADLYEESVDSNERPDEPVEPAAPAPAPTTPAAPVAPAVPAEPVTPAVTPQAPAAPVQPSAPVTPPVGEQPPVVPAVATPPAEPQPPVQPTQPVEPQETDAQRNERLTAERVKLTGQLEQMYAIPEAELETFRDAPESYLPKMAAKLHVEVLTAVANGIYAQLPNLIRNFQQAERQQTTHEEKFFTRWSKLNTPDLRPKVLELVGRYRSMNPNATFETLTEEVGAMAHVMYRIPYEDAPAGGTQPAAAPATTQQQRPHVPAGVGGATPPPAPANPNQFAQLAQEFLAEPGGW